MEKENTSKGFEHEHGFEHESGTESLIDLSAFFRNFFGIFFRRLWAVILAALIGGGAHIFHICPIMKQKLFLP